MSYGVGICIQTSEPKRQAVFSMYHAHKIEMWQRDSATGQRKHGSLLYPCANPLPHSPSRTNKYSSSPFSVRGSPCSALLEEQGRECCACRRKSGRRILPRSGIAVSHFFILPLRHIATPRRVSCPSLFLIIVPSMMMLMTMQEQGQDKRMAIPSETRTCRSPVPSG